jgi:hypothetical protein
MTKDPVCGMDSMKRKLNNVFVLGEFRERVA